MLISRDLIISLSRQNWLGLDFIKISFVCRKMHICVLEVVLLWGRYGFRVSLEW